MSHLTRHGAWACAILIAALVLSGCAQGNENAPTPRPRPTNALNPDPQPLSIWHGLTPSEHTAMQRIAGQFAEVRPDIAIQIEIFESAALLPAYETAVMAGTGPDIVLGPSAWIASLSAKGLIQPLNPDFIQQRDTTLPQTVVESAQIAGMPYAIPFSAEFATLYINRALIDEPPQIWDQVAPAAEQTGLVVTPTFLVVSGLYFTHGAQLVTEDGAPLATRPEVETYLTELQMFASEPGVAFTDDATAFATRQAGMLLSSSNDFAALQAALGDDLTVAALPRFPPRQWSTLLECTVFMQNLNSTTEAIEATRAFAEFFLSPDIQRAWFEATGQAPVNPAGLDDATLRATWAETLEWGTPAPISHRFETEIRPALDRAVEAVVSNSESVEDAATRILATIGDGGP